MKLFNLIVMTQNNSLRELIQQQGKMKAIRKFRELYGWDLTRCKQFTEKFKVKW